MPVSVGCTCQERFWREKKDLHPYQNDDPVLMNGLKPCKKLKMPKSNLNFLFGVVESVDIYVPGMNRQKYVLSVKLEKNDLKGSCNLGISMNFA